MRFRVLLCGLAGHLGLYVCETYLLTIPVSVGMGQMGQRLEWYARMPTTTSGRSRPGSTKQQVLLSIKLYKAHWMDPTAVIYLAGEGWA
ncbi:hypothetical protein L211DRAFT_839452 [Terfezia boudieri ATCC MYA-4762]|uniref:Uncharacterized protein n=1 Tax=Terfezia boudieri ATCC MYA-4762 TaxID=1051890 RepID=A0A3N4LXF9_9PEZI|nr:hypothetical protein L211DRAFT_839452 [Terfezia boudieri ATCC MYA-4762]